MNNEFVLTDKQRAEHIARVEWNENILEILGLTMRKTTRDIFQLSVDQGKTTYFGIYYCKKRLRKIQPTR